MIYEFAKQFSKTPGPRFKKLGSNSGEEFREKFLEKWFKENTEVVIDTNGVVLSFSPSFLSESFGKIAENYGEKKFFNLIHFKNDSELNKIFERKVREHVKRALSKKVR